MRNILGEIILFGFLLVSCCAFIWCNTVAYTPEGNAVYYWKTVLSLSDEERSFLKENNISSVYLRLFDIKDVGGHLVPSATLNFQDTLPPEVEIIPTIFIAPDALKGGASTDSLAERIIERADAMLTLNGYGKPKEIQVDFDWTLGNRAQYFAFLSHLRELLHVQGRRVSTTVRLHQLRQTPPPVDYGTLMVYNVGNITDPDEVNSILSFERVKPYLGDIDDYDLPLATALPLFSWNLLFSGGQFRAIIHSPELNDTASFLQVDSTHFRCLRYGSVAVAGSIDRIDGRIYPGDTIRHEEVAPELLLKVADAIKERRQSATHRIILYHLDQKSLQNYEKKDFENIWTADR